MSKRLPTPFQYRGKWRASISIPGGKRRVRDFERFEEARQWIATTISSAIEAPQHEQKLGGPTTATLAQALTYYAEQYTTIKGGATAELTRINQYRAAASLPPLRLTIDANGHRSIVEGTSKAVPSAFNRHNEQRRALRSGTADHIRKLATKRCNAISTADLREFKTCMEKECLSASTIQKEIALLRHVFNMAVQEWNWLDFKNPCRGIKLGKSATRFVVLPQDKVAELMAASAQCYNPLVATAIGLALDTALRKDSLLSLDWSRIDLESRTLKVKSKTGDIIVALSQTSVEILKRLPRSESGRVLPMSSNALDMAWDGVRQKIGLPRLQFRDLRHVAATRLAKAGMTAPQLQRVLGHKTIHMAQVYVNLAQNDMLEVLDALAPLDPMLIVEPGHNDPQAEATRRRSERMTDVIRQRALSTSAAQQSDARTPVMSAQEATLAPNRDLPLVAVAHSEANQESVETSPTNVVAVDFIGRRVGRR